MQGLAESRRCLYRSLMEQRSTWRRYTFLGQIYGAQALRKCLVSHMRKGPRTFPKWFQQSLCSSNPAVAAIRITPQKTPKKDNDVVQVCSQRGQIGHVISTVSPNARQARPVVIRLDVRRGKYLHSCSRRSPSSSPVTSLKPWRSLIISPGSRTE